MKGKCGISGLNQKSLCLKTVAKLYQNVDRLTIEGVKIDENIINALDLVIENNKHKIQILELNDIDYNDDEYITKLFHILNKLKALREVKIGNVGNKDRLIHLLIENNYNFKFADQVKALKIDNILLSQIISILPMFKNVEELSIENCSLDEDLSQVAVALKNTETKNKLRYLNLSYNGLSSSAAMESLKQIIRSHQDIQKLVLKGLWFKNIAQLKEDLKHLSNLQSLEMVESKNIFDDLNSLSVFAGMENLKVLSLGDSSVDDADLRSMFQCLHSSDCNHDNLEELNLYRSSLTNESINTLIAFKHKLKSLKYINFGFNQKITSAGLNQLCENAHLFPKLKHVDLRNCGIDLKKSANSLIELIRTKPPVLEQIDLYFCGATQQDYISFIKSVHSESQQNKLPQDIRLKLYLKLNRPSSKDLFKKVEKYTEELYKRHNLIIR